MKEFMKKISMPPEAFYDAERIYNILISPEYKNDIDNAIAEYIEKGLDFGIQDYIEKLSKKLAENIYIVHLAFLLRCALKVKPAYDEKGIPDEIYYDTMTDISYKVIECKTLHGVYGVDVFLWYHELFSMTTIKLGRLEYTTSELVYDSYQDYVKKGDRVYNLHIPSSGPLTYEAVIDSFKRAYKFFGCREYIVIHCGSWLVYPPYRRELYKKGSNLDIFCSLFDMIVEVETGKGAIYRWVFGKPDDTPESELPQNTSLQKNFVKYFREGKKTGVGRGIAIFDGENIINIQS